MTNEEAIKEIQRWLDGCPFENTKEAFNLAIQALETGEIYITGKDYSLYIEGYKAGKKDFEPKKGEWVKVVNSGYPSAWHYECSECHERPLCSSFIKEDFLSNFCPNCGADMRGKEE